VKTAVGTFAWELAEFATHRMLQAVEAAGAALAVPLQESFQPRKSV
jgi:hypothetical protein